MTEKKGKFQGLLFPTVSLTLDREFTFPPLHMHETCATRSSFVHSCGIIFSKKITIEHNLAVGDLSNCPETDAQTVSPTLSQHFEPQPPYELDSRFWFVISDHLPELHDARHCTSLYFSVLQPRLPIHIANDPPHLWFGFR